MLSTSITFHEKKHVTNRLLVYLADLTHETPMGYGSDTMPLQLGLLAAYAKSKFGDAIEVRVFKFVSDLSEACENSQPDIVGFSHYVWNAELSLGVANILKKESPETLIVFGGPNYPETVGEQVAWLQLYPEIDIHVFRDGEIPFAEILEARLEGRTNDQIKRSKLLSCHALVNNEPYFGPLADRLVNLDIVPSPYLLGIMDSFFEHRLVPAIRTNRGCPFKCTFCAEGHDYYNKIARRSLENKLAEVEYIANRVRHTKTLRIADSNFGMYKEDLEFSRGLRSIKQRTGFPDYVNCASGKNKKELVLECNALLDGAMRLTASVQSLNADVLRNVKRNNISTDAIMGLADRIADMDTHGYSEVILALPGDSLAAQQETMSGLVNSGIGNITQHQLSLIPGTEMAGAVDRERFGMRTMFRPIQRCLGKYLFLGVNIVAVDVEEICIENNTLSFSDYLTSRRLYFVIGLFYNDTIFAPVQRLLRTLDISPWNWINRIATDDDMPPRLSELFDGFINETIGELWDTREALFADVAAQIDQFASGARGGNLIYKYRSKALIEHYDILHQYAMSKLLDTLAEANVYDAVMMEELDTYCYLRNTALFDPTPSPVHLFNYDFRSPTVLESNGNDYPSIQPLTTPLAISFKHSASQVEALERELDFYGRDIPGFTMMLSRFPLKRFFRQPVVDPNVQHPIDAQSMEAQLPS